jgi:hypothetical protein
MGSPLKRLCIALVLASAFCASAFVAAAAGENGTPAQEWESITPALALGAAKAETAGWLAYWKGLEPVKTSKMSPGYEIVLEKRAFAAKAKSCVVSHNGLAPYFCRQRSSFTETATMHPLYPGYPTETQVVHYCLDTVLRVGQYGEKAIHPTRRSAHFGEPGLRTRFDAPVKNLGFTAVESPPESSDCGVLPSPTPPPQPRSGP